VSKQPSTLEEYFGFRTQQSPWTSLTERSTLEKMLKTRLLYLSLSWFHLNELFALLSGNPYAAVPHVEYCVTTNCRYRSSMWTSKSLEEFRGNSGKIDPVLLENCSMVYFWIRLGFKMLSGFNVGKSKCLWIVRVILSQVVNVAVFVILFRFFHNHKMIDDKFYYSCF